MISTFLNQDKAFNYNAKENNKQNSLEQTGYRHIPQLNKKVITFKKVKRIVILKDRALCSFPFSERT